MKTKHAVRLASSGAELARILGIKRQAVDAWGVNIPKLREYQLKELKPEWFEPKKSTKEKV